MVAIGQVSESINKVYPRTVQMLSGEHAGSHWYLNPQNRVYVNIGDYVVVKYCPDDQFCFIIPMEKINEIGV